ncbi:MAG: hypothetical protein ACT4QF_02040 [Sporichthyaceae bacterium]
MTVRLGTTRASVEIREHRARWLRTGAAVSTRRIEFLDWTLDGRPLRDIVGGVRPVENTTPLRDDLDLAEFRQASLKALLGMAPGMEGVRFDDGRVAVLFCVLCGDLGCGALSVEVIVGPDTVEWRDVGWQTDYQPFDPHAQDDPVFGVFFGRAQYEAVVRDLMNGEAASG